MKIVVFSDTHGGQRKVLLPEGDLLIYAGDMTVDGRRSRVIDFLKWLGRQPHPHKILIAGNHDFFFEEQPPSEINLLIPAGVTYLEDSGTTVNGIKIWGSPITPWFHNWAFNRQPGPDIQRHWDLIPGDTDILITHGPPYGILDKTTGGLHVGCPDLLKKVQEITPRLHIFGHIHEAAGITQHGATTFINASILDERYHVKNQPVVVELDI